MNHGWTTKAGFMKGDSLPDYQVKLNEDDEEIVSFGLPSQLNMRYSGGRSFEENLDMTAEDTLLRQLYIPAIRPITELIAQLNEMAYAPLGSPVLMYDRDLEEEFGLRRFDFDTQRGGLLSSPDYNNNGALPASVLEPQQNTPTSSELNNAPDNLTSNTNARYDDTDATRSTIQILDKPEEAQQRNESQAPDDD